MMITGGEEFTEVLDVPPYDPGTEILLDGFAPHFPREHAAAVGKPAKKLIETYLRQRRILKQSEEEERLGIRIRVSGREISRGVGTVQKTVAGARDSTKDGDEKKSVYTVAGGKEEENQADKSAGPIARLNLIIQTHAISSSSASRSAPLMFNHSRNACFAKRN